MKSVRLFTQRNRNFASAVTACYKFPFATLWCLLFICTTSFGQNSFWYDFKGTATLKVNYTHNPGQGVWTVFTHNMFPDQEIRLKDTIPEGFGNRNYVFPVSCPQKVTLTTAGKELTLLLTPGSTLVCNLDFQDLAKTSFDTQDSLAAINEYLIKKDLSVSIPFRIGRSIAVQRATTLEELTTQMNKLYIEELQFFTKEKSGLPAWYHSYEYWENRYADAAGRMNAVPQREFSKQTKEPVPSNYYNFLDSLAVDNDAAKSSYSYYIFLYELFNKRMKDHDLAHGTKSDFLDYQIAQANKSLSGDALDFFKAFIIQLVHNHYKKDVARNYIKNNNSVFTKTIWRDELSAYFKSKEAIAGKGKIPPNFALVDVKDSLTELKSFKGNVIVLSFWFAGCKPCIEEFPAENILAEKFRHKPVRIVSVCVNTSEAMWKKWSERFGLKTINLWANSAWEQTIVEKYDLRVFPKYVLIDKDYKIVETDADRPSQGLEKQINSLLEK
ncbi:Peroxiredoxin [Dyadobacter soli]|uniref:Peroxiredoxin n=2 Tax=Dyadobacter soli TaxID=659014 RepID=A0A1G8CYB0_9BACT|nr:Peroxiredoxin [Dyadobacter soli]